MRRKPSYRYYCDYCKKSGGSGSAMAIHEKHCTMNPNRVCRFCATGADWGMEQHPMAEAVLHGSRWTDTSRLARAILEAAE